MTVLSPSVDIYFKPNSIHKTTAGARKKGAKRPEFLVLNNIITSSLILLISHYLTPSEWNKLGVIQPHVHRAVQKFWHIYTTICTAHQFWGGIIIGVSVMGSCDFRHIHLLNISMMGLPGKKVLEMKKYHFTNEYSCLFWRNKYLAIFGWAMA